MTTILLRNAAVLDPDRGDLRANHDVLVQDRRIAAVGRGLAPRADQVIDLGGRTLMAGLIDCHIHVCSDALVAHPPLQPSFVTAKSSHILRDTLMRGFTTIRDVGGADSGLRLAVEKGYFTGPRLFVAGRPISQTGGHGDMRHPADLCPVCAARSEASMIVIADGETEMRKAVREEVRRGADHIKIMASGGIASPADPVDYDQYSLGEIETAVDEARRAGRYVAAHAYMASAITRAVEAGVRTIEHGNFIDEDAAAAMARHGAYLVPTLIVYRRVVEHAQALGISAFHLEKARQVLAVGTRSLDIARRAGVKIAFGTDLVRPAKDHQCEEFLVRAEVQSPAEIIRSATLVGAEIVGMAGRLGRVEEGYLADLIAIDGSPLDDLNVLQDQGAHIPVIVKDGGVVKNDLGA